MGEKCVKSFKYVKLREIRMFNVVFGILFLVQFTTIGFCQVPQSPCPKYFHYHQDEMTGEIVGIVAMPPPLPNEIALMLSVTFHYPIPVPSNYNSYLELLKTKTDYAPVQQAIDQGNPLFFRVRFPYQHLLPVVNRIIFNNEAKCIGPRVTWPIFTSIDLQKTLYPPSLLSFLRTRFNSTNHLNHPEMDKNSIPSLMPTKNSTVLDSKNNSGSTSTFSDFELNKNCGISANANLSIDIRFEGGDKIYPGQWPWLVAILYNSKINLKGKFEFRCIGNLISNKHIITAAHCVKEDDENILPEELLVILGKYNLALFNETGALKMNIKEIRIHPEFNNNFTNADSDLAILVLENPVKYSSLIQSICLWKEPIDLEKIVGEKGTIIGWRKYGKRYKGEPYKTIEQIVSQEECLRSNSGFVEITSNRTFCAGNRNGNGPCYGDSGSGFVLQDPTTKRYHLRGIVSLTIFDEKIMSCDLTQYVVYVDVAKHLDWIKKQIFIDLN